MVAAALVALLALAVQPARSQPATTPRGPVARVRLPFPQDDGSLTPYTFELGYPLMTLVYDTLLWRGADGVPQPWLARSVDTSADGRTLTIRLADGARWHDGPPVTSADVAFTFAWVAAHPHPRFTDEVAAVERVAAPDPATAVVTLRRSQPGFADQPLADLPILPKHLWEHLAPGKAAPDGLAVGSGPYRLAEHVPGQRYRFEAVPGYFLGPPAVATIEVPIMGGVDDTVHALERGDVDMVPVNLPDTLKKRLDTLSVKVAEGASYAGTVLLFNLRSAPFDRPEVRRAVAGSVDLGRIARAEGGAVAADHGYLHPESPFSSPDVLHAIDRATARPVLRSLTAPVIVLAPDNDPAKVEAGRLVAQAVIGAGGAAEVKAVPKADYERAIGENGGAPSFQAAIWTTPPLASYDPAILGRLFGSGPASAALNLAGYHSDAFDELARRVATTADPASRKAATREALGLLAADDPVLPLYFAGGAFAYRPAVYDGWVFVKGSGILDKRSFAGPRPVATTTTRPTTPTAVVDGAAGKGGGLPAGTLAVAGLAGAVLLAAVAVVIGRRQG